MSTKVPYLHQEQIERDAAALLTEEGTLSRPLAFAAAINDKKALIHNA